MENNIQPERRSTGSASGLSTRLSTSNFQRLYDAGDVQRWHTWRSLNEQTVAAHSWGVAMVVAQIDPGNDAALKAALFHDLHEVEGGDIPYPAKRRYPDLGRAIAQQEADFNTANNVDELWNEHDKRVLKWADMFELLMFSKREYHMGNTKFLHTIEVAINALREMGPPTEAARQLMLEFNLEY